MFAKQSCYHLLVVFAVLFAYSGSVMAVPQQSRTPSERRPGASIRVVVWTDKQEYSPRDYVKVNVSLQNAGNDPVFIDRRMFWTGLAGGLELELRDEQGKRLPAKALSDAMMPPPSQADTSILIRLDGGFFYGSFINLLAKDFFPQPGNYSIRIIYKSWLRKELVAPQFRVLPALWADTPEIPSEPVLIRVIE